MQPTPQNAPVEVAVFDFDGTSIDGQSGSLFTTYLFKRRAMSVGLLLRLAWWGVRYKMHLPFRQDEARELVFAALREMTPAQVDAIMREFFHEVLEPKYRPLAVAEVKKRISEGCVTLLVSATFEPIADEAAKSLGMTAAIATKMERDAQGNYTGQVDGPVIAGEEKYRVVERWCNEHLGAGAWVLAWAYADHHTDKDLLARAQHPCAVCPGKTLKPYAKREGWQICDWDE